MKISGLPVDLPRGLVSRDEIATQLAVLMTFGLNFVVFGALLRTEGTARCLPNPSFQNVNKIILSAALHPEIPKRVNTLTVQHASPT